MSLVFLKSRDKQTNQAQQRYNPNKPFRFSNYLTQPLRLPPNSQVAYVSSQFTIAPNGDMSNEKTYIITEDKTTSVMTAPTTFEFPNTQPTQIGNWTDNLNQYVLSANEFSMDSDYTGQIYDTAVELGDTQTKPRSGFQMLYDVGNDKPILRMVKHIPIDQYNLYFNACRTNPDFNFGGVGGGVYPSGINWGSSTDPKFYDDINVKSVVPPTSTSVFGTSSNFGLVIDELTNETTATAKVYAGGANFYNTGWSATNLTSNGGNYRFDLAMSNPLSVMPPYNTGNIYPLVATTTGIKKCIGSFTPSSGVQPSNTGGHATQPSIGETGGYGLWTQSNLLQAQANTHYNTLAVGDNAEGSSLEGFTGLAPIQVGVMSIPYMRQVGYDTAVANGSSNEQARNVEVQFSNYASVCDMNASQSATTPEGSHARYLFGYEIQSFYGGSAGTGDCIVQAKVLDCVNGSIENSKYVNIGEPLSIKKLAQGITTAVVPEYEFSTGVDYGINTYNTIGTRTPAMLFFRFRWINKTQMDLEYTLSISGGAGTYNNAEDTPHDNPLPYVAPPVIPSTPQTIRLDGTTDGTSVGITSQTSFLDSGGASNPYQPNELYDIIFEAPVDTNAVIVLNDINIEMSSAVAFDRLGVQISDDGASWANVDIVGFNNMVVVNNPNNPAAAAERDFVGGSWTGPSQEAGGWIVPSSSTQFTANGGVMGQAYNLGKRYIRFRFVSDGSGQPAGWDIGITAISAVGGAEQDPRDKWCLLASMNPDNELLRKYHIPSYMGDIGMVQYPIAITQTNPNNGWFRGCVKGWFNPRESNRFFQNNNNGGGRPTAPMTPENIFYDKDGLGVLTFQPTAPTNPEQTSSTLVNAGWTATTLPEQFNASTGWLDSDVNYLAIAYKTTADLDAFRTMEGYDKFQVGQPDNLELGYTLGFNEITDNTDVLTMVDFDSNTKQLLAVADISIGSQAFSNHIQLSNLPIISQNGVVSSINKTIYVCDSLCIDSTHDTSSFRYYCDKAPYPLWIDLNNLETIELNKIDVFISTDENTPQKSLTGNTQLVIQFRDKTSGQLINSIPVKSMPFTRTY